MRYEFLYYKGKRPDGSKGKLRNELLFYIKKEYEKKHIPSRREIQATFHLKISTLFKNIDDLYQKAGLRYKLIANQDIKAGKAKILIEIVKNLEEFFFSIIKTRDIRERGIDLVAIKNKQTIGIELKAYNKNEKLKIKDIKQVERFIRHENLDSAIIITTTDLKGSDVKESEKISIVYYSDLIKKINRKEDIEKLKYIRNSSVNIDDSQKLTKRKIILDYVYIKYKEENKKPTYNDILEDLHLDLYNYFKNLFEIYKILRIPPSLKNMGGKRAKNPDVEVINLWKEEFKKYILEEIKKGNKYPSGYEIAKRFEISNIWNIVNVSDIYRELGLKTYLERKRKITSVPNA